MAFQPMFDKVLIKPLEAKEQLKGGIIIPDTAKEKPQEGEVISLGSGKVLDNGTKQDFVVKVGDKVLFGKYSGTEVKIEGETYLIMREEDVLGIVS